MPETGKSASWLCGLIGAVVGTAIGYFAFFLLTREGVYALVLPGALLGIGCGGLSAGKSNILGVVCGLLAVLAGIFTEWRFAPFNVDDSLGYFLTHLDHLRRLTLISLVAGGFFGFWFGRGRPGGAWTRRIKSTDPKPQTTADGLRVGHQPTPLTIARQSQSASDSGNRREMEFQSDPFVLRLFDDPAFSPAAMEEIRAGGREYSFCEGHQVSSRYGVSCREANGSVRTCVLLAAGGASKVGSHSAVIAGDRCFVAVGDRLCSLALPSLRLDWSKQVDSATCFGVYYSPDHDCLFSHGELEIVRVSLAGDIAWSAMGKDIFSEGFRLTPDFAEAVDFNGQVYHFDLTMGRPLP